ncbi:fimbrial protein (plasmid) [Escherichia albertii]|uniref:fimbrial protein n=1 Tax=Escherichia albertii TaxID=208962 RepID=UPI00235F3BCD|nr:fimbrial protein [Escherichia albertii]MCZ8880685.1 fimbrial protein [Escherichia albertii]MCZ9212492.1 fimbrial protein [Escherichia albertii]WDB90917.1 fimbrial protein [Escherichia albertii]
MKKLMAISVIAMSMAAGSAMASQGDVKFFGSVTEITCDVVPEVNGSVNNMIQLGSVKKDTLGEEVSLVFKAADASGQDCAQLVSGKTASIAWSGNLTSKGIGAQGGLAEDAYVVLKPKNGTNTNVITSANNVAEFAAENVAGNGLQFIAQLQGGQTVGDFQSAAAYAVSYK